MAFGRKKNKEIADTIFRDGFVYTQDSQYPWATAVATRGGRVLAVGDFDAMEHITDEDTKVIDLNGRYLFPGFIQMYEHPVLKAFEGKYLSIDVEWDLDTVIENLRDYAADNPDNDVIFAYGYNENILNDYNKAQGNAMLNDIDVTRPIVVLGDSGVHVWYNHFADDIIKKAAELDCIQYPNLTYILNLLVPFEYDLVLEAVKETADYYADKGITAIFNTGSPEYFNDLYQDGLIAMINDETICQRFYGSLYVNRPINPKTLSYKLMESQSICLEVGDKLNYNFIKIAISDDRNTSYFSQDALTTICLAMAERGFNFHLDAADPPSVERAMNTFQVLRAKGYKKNILILATDAVDAETLKNEYSESDSIFFTWETNPYTGTVEAHSSSVADAIDNLTYRAAEMLGIEEDFGSIERGKIADFTVFEDNPMEKTLTQFSRMHADMVVLDGDIVYDAQDAADQEMYNLLLQQQL